MASTLDRRMQAAGELRPGRIIYVSTPDISYDKFLVIAAIEPYLMGFYINTGINEFIQRRPKLLRCQAEIECQNHRPYLKVDSWADCAHVITAVTRASAITQATADPTRLKRDISATERARVIAAVSLAPTIEPVVARTILGNLNR